MTPPQRGGGGRVWERGKKKGGGIVGEGKGSTVWACGRKKKKKRDLPPRMKGKKEQMNYKRGGQFELPLEGKKRGKKRAPCESARGEGVRQRKRKRKEKGHSSKHNFSKKGGEGRM